MSLIEIMRLRPEHLDGLVRFFSEINTPDYAKEFSPHPFDAKHAGLVCNHEGRDLYFAVLLNGQEVIAYAMLRGWDEGYAIPSIGLCVRKDYQGLGLGRLIMEFLESISRLNGCSKLMLKVKKDNEKAKSLYVSQGYLFRDHDVDFLIGFKDISKGTNT